MKQTAQLLAGLFVGCFVAGCSVGTPPGFSVPPGTETWALPLVGPLENGVLVTPVMIGDRGPYLFMIDPDTEVSAVDRRIVRDGDLWQGQGRRRLDETNTSRPRSYAEVRSRRAGSRATSV